MFKIKRSYKDPDIEDGFRILVERLWPRELSKKKARLDLWMKEIAPTNELRKKFGHDPEKYDEFKDQYLKELEDKKELIKQLKTLEKMHRTITMVYSAKDEEHNNAVVLLELLNKPTKQIVMSISKTHG
jgi:uncharacterized protein YeaO (DUF488 family)